jgi:Tfp pilus assembly protein PilO
MSGKRAIVIFGSLILVVVAVAGWFLLLSPRLATAGELNDQRDSVETANAVTRTQIAELNEMKEQIGQAKADADLLTRRFPPTAEQSVLFNLVQQAAASAGIPASKISTLTISVPTLGTTDGSVTLPGATAAPAPAADASATGTVPSDPAAAPPAAPGGGLASMTVDVTVSASEERLAAFVQALENMDRAFLVTGINIAGTGETGGSSLTLSGTMFLLPELVDPTAEVVADPATDTTTGTTSETAPDASGEATLDGTTDEVVTDESVTDGTVESDEDETAQ